MSPIVRNIIAEMAQRRNATIPASSSEIRPTAPSRYNRKVPIDLELDVIGLGTGTADIIQRWGGPWTGLQFPESPLPEGMKPFLSAEDYKQCIAAANRSWWHFCLPFKLTSLPLSFLLVLGVSAAILDFCLDFKQLPNGYVGFAGIGVAITSLLVQILLRIYAYREFPRMVTRIEEKLQRDLRALNKSIGASFIDWPADNYSGIARFSTSHYVLNTFKIILCEGMGGGQPISVFL